VRRAAIRSNGLIDERTGAYDRAAFEQRSFMS